MIEGPPVTPMYYPMQQAVAEALQLPPEQWAFKSDRRYTDVLEHVKHQQGLDILHALQVTQLVSPDVRQEIMQRFPGIARDNDSMGTPIQYPFTDLDSVCSPQNLQYVWHAVKFLAYLLSQGITRTSIIEIGGGYGGQVLYTRRLCDLFGIDILQYAVVDIPYVIDVQRIFCERLGVPILVADGREGPALDALIASLPEPLTLFSCYAFAEFEKSIRDWYVEKLVRHCPHGVMIWNTHVGSSPDYYPYQFIDRPMTVVEDNIPVYPDWPIWDVFW